MLPFATIADAVTALDTSFPISTQDSWDNSGLLVGNPQQQLKGILFTVDINEQRVSEAVSRGCNLIVAHHPILFRGLKRIVGGSDEQRTIVAAIKNDVAICAFHTPADMAPDGLSYQLGRMIGLNEMSVLAPGADGLGYGIVGELPSALSVSEFLSVLASRLECRCIRYSEFDAPVRRVAVCTGSGSEFIDLAMKNGADAYVTGDVKYHQFQSPERRMLLADVGHYESEAIAKKLFLDIVSERLVGKFSNFALCISESCSNAVKYYVSDRN